jgi:heptosyltransferase-2
VIFGGANEKILSQKIRQKLGLQTQEYRDLAGKTSIQELIEYISNLDVFVTGDSGPMHIAAALNIPTVSIFGPTKDNETSQWMNRKNVIVKLDLDCQPCMQRECPLKHNNCMNMIDANMVYKEIRKLL